MNAETTATLDRLIFDERARKGRCLKEAVLDPPLRFRWSISLFPFLLTFFSLLSLPPPTPPHPTVSLSTLSMISRRTNTTHDFSPNLTQARRRHSLDEEEQKVASESATGATATTITTAVAAAAAAAAAAAPATPPLVRTPMSSDIEAATTTTTMATTPGPPITESRFRPHAGGVSGNNGSARAKRASSASAVPLPSSTSPGGGNQRDTENSHSDRANLISGSGNGGGGFHGSSGNGGSNGVGGGLFFDGDGKASSSHRGGNGGGDEGYLLDASAGLPGPGPPPGAFGSSRGGGGGGAVSSGGLFGGARVRCWFVSFLAAMTVASVSMLVADRALSAPRPRCEVEYGLRSWGPPDPVNHWANVTIDLDVRATGNVPFYAPYDVEVGGGNYLRALRTWNLNVTTPTAYSKVKGRVSNWWMHLQPGARPLGMGLTVEVWSGDGAPASVSVGGVSCALKRRGRGGGGGGGGRGGNSASNLKSASNSAAPSPPPAAPVKSALTLRDGKIFDTDSPDTEIFLAGINYMGFEYGLTMLDGIGPAFKRRESTSQDLATIAWRMRMLGINAVRLPFDFKSVMTRAADAAQIPCWRVLDSEVVDATTDPAARSVRRLEEAQPPPRLPHSPEARRGWCNHYAPPAETLLDRFLWVVDFFASNGFYVMLDNQFNYDRSATDDPGLWVAQWGKLWREMVARHPESARRVLLDVLNEPDVWGLGWSPGMGKDEHGKETGEPVPAAGDLYLEAMDALDAEWPGSTVFVLQGCGQPALAKNWGDGLATDAAVIARLNLTDPRPFFDALVSRPYASNVVLGPHVYPPSVWDTQRSQPAGNKGSDLFERLTTSFGYLNKKGYCSEKKGSEAPCFVFPVILGETGTGFVDDRDWPAMVDLAQWSRATGRGADGKHGPISGVFWWAWGMGHEEEGRKVENDMGLVDEAWHTVRFEKVRFLQRFGFQPWYASGKSSGAARKGSSGSAEERDGGGDDDGGE